jgi:hypothetical protein
MQVELGVLFPERERLAAMQKYQREAYACNSREVAVGLQQRTD